MTTVFIAGSIKIKNIDPLVAERIHKIISENLHVIVGDANGVDKSVQEILFKKYATNVTVYCSGDVPRNNIGRWNLNAVVSSAEPGTRDFFSAKDKEMAKDADIGLMLWDMASAGTLSNVFEMVSRSKKCVVFLNRERKFFSIKTSSDLFSLVSWMSDAARMQADRKIGLSKKLSNLDSSQLGLGF